MSTITPLYTLTEINAEIATWKLCYSSLAAGKSYTVNNGASSQSYTTHDIDIVWKQLQNLQAIRTQLQSNSAGGTQMLIGRPRR